MSRIFLCEEDVICNHISWIVSVTGRLGRGWGYQENTACCILKSFMGPVIKVLDVLLKWIFHGFHRSPRHFLHSCGLIISLRIYKCAFVFRVKWPTRPERSNLAAEFMPSPRMPEKMNLFTSAKEVFGQCLSVICLFVSKINSRGIVLKCLHSIFWLARGDYSLVKIASLKNFPKFKMGSILWNLKSQ